MNLNFRYLLFLLLVSQTLFAQRDNVWIFGDSVRLDYNQPGTIKHSNMYRNWGCASVSDTAGNLQYYIGSGDFQGATYGFLYDSNNNIVANGNTIYNYCGINFNAFNSYLESDSIIDLVNVSLDPLHPPGLYRTRINQNSNQIIISNEPIEVGLYPSDGVQEIRHGNGRDWWVVWKDFDRQNQTQKRNNFRVNLFQADGTVNTNIQSIGTLSMGGKGRIRFNKDGTKLALATGSGLVEVYDFDRCTGIISNPVQLKPDNGTLGVPISCEFSPSGQKLYISLMPYNGNPSHIAQYDLTAPVPSQTRYVVHAWPSTVSITGSLQIWLDDKLYVATADSFSHYPTTFYTPNIANISRIEFPDLSGSACNFNLNCVYLNGDRSCGALPNNPNYALKEWQGSGCDTLSLTGIKEEQEDNVFALYPVPATNAVNIQMKTPLKNYCSIEIVNMAGQLILSEDYPAYFFRKTIDIAGFDPGLYLLLLKTDKTVTSRKFQKF